MPLTLNELKKICKPFGPKYVKPKMGKELAAIYKEIWIQLGKPPQSEFPKVKKIGNRHYKVYLTKYMTAFNKFYYNEEKKGVQFKDAAVEFSKKPVMSIPYTETPEYQNWRISLNAPAENPNIPKKSNEILTRQHQEQQRELPRLEKAAIERKRKEDERKQKEKEEAERKQKEKEDAERKKQEEAARKQKEELQKAQKQLEVK
jgi:hypothetical protein